MSKKVLGPINVKKNIYFWTNIGPKPVEPIFQNFIPVEQKFHKKHKNDHWRLLKSLD